MDLELRHHRHALALSAHAHFGKAAAALGITQPALSRSIGEIERRVGKRLFGRSRQGVEPTDAGRVFLRHAERLLAEADAVERELQLLGGFAGAELRVGAGVFPAEMLVGAAVASIMVEYPSLKVAIESSMVDTLMVGLRRRQLDIVIGDLRTAQAEQDLRVTPLAWHRAHAMVRPGHPLAKRRRPTAAELLSYPLAMSSRTPADLMIALLEARGARGSGAAPALPAVTSDSATVLRQVAARSDVVVLATRGLARHELARGELVVLDFEAPWLGRSFAVIELADRERASAVERFVECVIAADRETAAAD